jgi:hypothetical protein
MQADRARIYALLDEGSFVELEAKHCTSGYARSVPVDDDLVLARRPAAQGSAQRDCGLVGHPGQLTAADHGHR